MEEQRNAIARWAATSCKQAGVRIAGYALNRLWVHILFFSAIPFTQSSNPLLSLFSNMFISLLCLACCLIFIGSALARVEHLLLSRYFVGFGTCACVIGTALVRVAGLGTAAETTLAVASGLMTGVGSAMLYVGWVRVFGREPLAKTLKEICLAQCLSFAIGIVLAFAPSPLLLSVLLASPALSGLFLRACSFVRPTNDELAPKAENSEQNERSRTLPMRNRFGIFAFGLVAGFANVLCSHAMYAHDNPFAGWLLIAGLAMSIVLVALFWNGDHRGAKQGHRFALLLMALGCMVVALSQSDTRLANMLVYAGFSCFGAILLVTALTIGKLDAANPVHIACICASALYFGEIAGLAFGHIVEFSWISDMSMNRIGLLLTAILIISYLFLLTETDFSLLTHREAEQTPSLEAETGTTAQVDAGSEKGSTHANQPTIESAYERIADDFGLSPREREILPLLVRGRTIARIQEELFISASTVNTHIRHIYTKCKVDSKQSLLDLIEEHYLQ